MPHYCFTLQVRPDRLEEYTRRHAAVWPEMLEALAASGWRDYRLFLREDGLLVGTVEADDLDAAQAAMDATEVNARWQADMAPFFADLPGGRPDTGAARLALVFDLDAQRTAGHPPGPAPGSRPTTDTAPTGGPR
ncbi:L-rhamnose mutarotase [uncultured Pseudokineococcus sp.]|uniref:L-rhamnose mutarotase n=1 Tax=uncultured Pseudokineococcus sp. TaxID=1642928 RepID=UPI002637B0C4|nr:L-rhamnose mutarotase [uncultured Pseudokineococcus sp.]